MTNELLEFEGGLLGLALNLDVPEIGTVVLGRRRPRSRRASRSSAPARSSGAGRRRVPRPRGRPAGNPIDGQGPIEAEARRALEVQAPTVVQRQPVKEPMHGHQGHRRHDRHRPRPAPADHRRPPDRQDRGGDRTRSSTRRPTGSPATRQAGPLHLRRDRPEGLHHRVGQRCARGRRDGVHDSSRLAVRTRPGFKYLAPVHRLGDRPALDVRRASTSSSCSTT